MKDYYEQLLKTDIESFNKERKNLPSYLDLKELDLNGVDQENGCKPRPLGQL